MRSYGKDVVKGKTVYVGVDLHRKSWHVTMMTEEVQLFSGSIPRLSSRGMRLWKESPINGKKFIILAMKSI